MANRLTNLRTAITRAISIAEDEHTPLGSKTKGIAAKHIRMLAILQEALNQDDLSIAVPQPKVMFDKLDIKTMTAAELAHSLHRRYNHAIAVGIEMSDVELAEMSGVELPYANQLLRIMRRVHPSITTDWLETNRHVSASEMDMVASYEGKDNQQERYNQARSRG